jgi:hypothetical protein
MVGRVASLLRSRRSRESGGTSRFPHPSTGPLRGQAASPPGRASSLLALRAAAFAVLVAALAAYYARPDELPELSDWGDVAVLSFLLIPAVFALVYLMLPLWHARAVLLMGLALVGLAVVLTREEFDVAANFVKAFGVTLLGFWFLRFFENLAWVVLVAALVPAIDALSVWRGPTRHIVEEEEDVFSALSIAFPLPGEEASANLGLPDVLFFALFLAAAVRFGLRPFWTALGMTLSFGATLALAVEFDVAGLPALPGLCIEFLAVNADLIWARLRVRAQPAAP